jgi:type IV pilus assembly protein PilQ
MRKGILIIAVLLGSLTNSFGQKYTEGMLRSVLDSLAEEHEGLNNALQLNVSSLQLSELVNSVALENNLNISIDPALDQRISYNFYDAQVKDMLVFLYLNFEIEYDFIGSIISMGVRKKEEAKPEPPRKMDVSYNPANKFLSMNLKNDTLWMVAEELTRVTGKNFVIDPAVRDKVVNAYFLNRPYDQVLDMFAQSNELELSEEEDYYKLGKGENTAEPNSGNKPGRNKPANYKTNSANGDFVLEKNDIGTLDVFARNVELADLIQAAADETGVHYILYSDVKGKANLDLKDVRFDELVSRVFEGTDFSIKENEGVYIIGENKLDGLRITELLRLDNRTIESVKAAIPKEMLTGIEVLEFAELNGLILTGSKRKVEQLKLFISSIDVVVPMVQIDVMLLYSKKGAFVKTGISAGVGSEPTETQGGFNGGLDVTLGAQSINNILGTISGFGVVNLGQVTENFYLSLSALETNNVVQIESTPKISTLNGHEANISIGETTYYQETQVNVQTSVTNQGVLQSRQWKSIAANLSVTIKPFVSADEHVTLTISVQQDDFGATVSPDAPPDITTRTFESMIRVKNGEMILLGGLEEKRKSNSGNGFPILSRIPILKWIFSSREKDKSKSKLHILIRPTVSY